MLKVETSEFMKVVKLGYALSSISTAPNTWRPMMVNTSQKRACT